MAMGSAAAGFNELFREWRQFRRVSQLELALAANVSQRHVSWLETGRSRPSRDMVLRLAEALDIPLRARNALLLAAGFAATYNESSMEDPVMAPVEHALRQVLSHHEPLPAFVVDRAWNVRMDNSAGRLLLSVAGDPESLIAELGESGSPGEVNLALLTLHPEGLRRYITNWGEAAPQFVRRLRQEAAASGDRILQEKIAALTELAGVVDDGLPPSGALLPVLPLEIDLNGIALSLFSVISTFGTPQDITTDELRVEAFYPTDEATGQFFREVASAH
jgi:transcriptional regulator with XRE-family HTH domain